MELFTATDVKTSNATSILIVISANYYPLTVLGPQLLPLSCSLRILWYCTFSGHVRWFPCHHGMARPQVSDGGDALQLWREAANILNKQSRTADKGWSSSLGVGRGANNSPYKISLSQKHSQSLGPGRIPWINDLSERKWI
jgi:hypothetical protein